MKFPLFKRRKLALLFLLGVGLPSLALSALAFRGIQNELVLLQQRQLDDYRAIADLVGDSLLSRLEGVERSASGVVAGRTWPAEGLSAASIRALDSLRRDHPLLDATFFLDGDGQIRLATSDLLFRADAEVEEPRTPPWPSGAAADMRAGEEEEFQHGDPASAIRRYRAAFDSVSDPALEAHALLAVIRAQRKAGHTREAVASCEDLLHRYGGVRAGEGMPLGPVASLERGTMLAALGDSLRALEALVDLRRRLARGDWVLGRSQYEFLSGQVELRVRELTQGPAGTLPDSLAEAFRASKRAEAARRERAERILLFQATSGEDILARVRAGVEGSGRNGSRFELESGARTFLVSLVDAPSSGPPIWGLLLDEATLREDLLRPWLQTRVDTTSTEWIVRGRGGGLVLGGAGPPSGSLALNATIAGGFPPWLIEFYRRPRSPYRLLLASGQSVYLYMFLAIAIILGFGLVLTVRAVSHELELARLKSDFVSTVSHEFKSPLTSIRQLAEMLQSGRVASEERRQRYYDVLVEQSARLSSLVTNVLDLARIEEGGKESRLEALELGPLLGEAVENAQHRVGHEGFRLTVHIPGPLPPVRGNRDALGQAVSNLLDNAIRYSGEARDVRVVASADGEQVTVAVQDSGVGIPEEDRGKVFDRFYRGSHDVTRSVRGSGLGLTLVREIVEAHGGSVELSSQVGEGSTFTITLPATKEPDHG